MIESVNIAKAVSRTDVKIVMLKPPSKYKDRCAVYYKKCKREAMDHYGIICQCCGESTLDFLTIDHIEQNGAEHRRELNFNNSCTGYHFYLWLKKNNWPQNLGLQVLCSNCNTAKGAYGVCPHVLQK